MTTPLEGLRVIDASSLYAGPLAAMLLGDFGAEVIKIEPPEGDPARRLGQQKNGVGLAFKMLGRNKRSVTLDLGTEEGQALMLRLASRADVFIESFRPTTLERWNLGPKQLHEANPGLVIARVSGYGQEGPYRDRPGFGTLAEAMSGFAALTGAPDGPPTLPPFPLADSVTGMATALAVMMALRARERDGQGQVIDLSLIEPLLTMLGPQPTWFQQLGFVQPRVGNRSAQSAPRGVYPTRDGKWIALSASAPSVAKRVMALVGRPELAHQPWFATGQGRVEHADEIDAVVAPWIAARDLAEVLAAFEAAEAAAAPVYDIRDVFQDPQYQSLKSIIEVPDEELGPIAMQNVLFRLSRTPGRIRWAGPPRGQDNRAVLQEWLGLSPEELDRLTARGAL